MTQDIPDAETIKKFNAGLAEEFRAKGGKVSGQFAGANLLLLTTTGAKSGQPRLSPLAFFRIDGKLLILGSFRGADFHPAWVHNLRANPRAHIELGEESFDVVAAELSDEQRAEVVPKITELVPVFAEYQANTARVIPVFDLQRV